MTLALKIEAEKKTQKTSYTSRATRRTVECLRLGTRTYFIINTARAEPNTAAGGERRDRVMARITVQEPRMTKASQKSNLRFPHAYDPPSRIIQCPVSIHVVEARTAIPMVTNSALQV